MHNGSEYSFSLLEDKSIRLISHKQADLSQGFKHFENIYIKNVSVEEVENLFKINSNKKRKLFPVSEDGKAGKVILDTTTLNLPKMGFERTDDICTPNMWLG
jgi:hypothetical protein